MNTPGPSASGAHTRVTLQRTGMPLQIHATISSFDRKTGEFTALLDIDPQGSPAEAFTPDVSTGVISGYTDSLGFSWQLVR